MGARWSRPRRSDSGSGLQVDLLPLGAARAHVVTEVDLQGRPGLRRGDPDFAGRFRGPPEVLGDLAGSPRDPQAAIVVAERGNSTPTLFQDLAGDPASHSPTLASVPQFCGTAL